MICIPINGPTYQEAQEQIQQAIQWADWIELRLDCFESVDIEKIKALCSTFSIPKIFTLRSRAEGGHYCHSEENRLKDIDFLAQLDPDFFDLESSIDQSFLEQFLKDFPQTRVILSSHNFEKMPEDLESLYQEMKKKMNAFAYKIAVKANHLSETLRLISWAKNKGSHLIAISMGKDGEISRILSDFTYASLDDDRQSAPGQIPAPILINRYRYKDLSANKKIYGLIGDPVEQSISHLTHNFLLKKLNIDAFYIKMVVKPFELQECLGFFKDLPFCGLSVTMPLKECILPFLDVIDPIAKEIGAVNTLLFKEGQVLGYNTDCFGALNAIENKMAVKEKRVVLIGAGGAAKAIAYEVVKRGAKLTIVNRNYAKAKALADRFKCNAKDFHEMSDCAKEGYDILINCTPLPLPIDPKNILPGALVMDINTRPRETLFLIKAKELNCNIIYGEEMFFEQALGQFKMWFPSIDIEGFPGSFQTMERVNRRSEKSTIVMI